MFVWMKMKMDEEERGEKRSEKMVDGKRGRAQPPRCKAGANIGPWQQLKLPVGFNLSRTQSNT